MNVSAHNLSTHGQLPMSYNCCHQQIVGMHTYEQRTKLLVWVTISGGGLAFGGVHYFSKL